MLATGSHNIRQLRREGDDQTHVLPTHIKDKPDCRRRRRRLWNCSGAGVGIESAWHRAKLGISQTFPPSNRARLRDSETIDMLVRLSIGVSNLVRAMVYFSKLASSELTA